MTTLQIETLASSGNLPTADFQTGMVLRRMVIPEFLLDLENQIGRVHWLRHTWELPVLAGDSTYDLPADFDKFERIRYKLTAGGVEDWDLEYIGEHPNKILSALSSTSPGKAKGYWIEAGEEVPWAIRLDSIPDQAYTLYGIYYRTIPFDDESTEINLDPYVPAKYQAGIVKGLRCAIAKERWGAGDRRYTVEQAEYRDWVMKLERTKEAGQRSAPVFAR